MAISRRGFLGLGACFGLGAVVGARIGLPEALAPGPPRPVSGAALEMVAQAFEGLNREAVWDAHVHITGIGTGGSGCWVNPKMLRVTAPWRNFKFDIYRAAAGITDMSRADEQYVERLLALHELMNPSGKLVAMAFDLRVDEAGREDRDRSDFFVPNEYVFRLAKAHPALVPCASIHPYREDAIERLDRAVESGAVAIKWLPNAMGMDPASEKCDAFYARLAHHAIPLITHGGEELAVDSPEDQELGNPLRVKRALEHGVKVVVAHAASLGIVEDLSATPERLKMRAFDAFMRLFTDPKYEKLLYADISAVTQFHRYEIALRELLRARDLHPRLVNGSDYPLPCIDPLISSRLLERKGFITSEDRKVLNEIYDHNPLLYDFVLKRRVSIEEDDRSYEFSPGIFESAWLFRRPEANG